MGIDCILVHVDTTCEAPEVGYSLIERQLNTGICGSSDVVISFDSYLLMVGILKIDTGIVCVYVLKIQ